LIGRIGEDGDPRYVGDGMRWRAQNEGMLYLRIDDDILSDNEGFVSVDVRVQAAQTSEQPDTRSSQERVIVVTRVSPNQD
jgi:hypothetical protein